MKKRIFLTFAILTLFASSVLAYSDSNEFELTDNNSDSLPIQLSTNVLMDYDAATGGLGYSVATYHTSGTRTYGSSSGDATIFWYDGTAEEAVTAPSGTASADFSDWNEL